MNLDTCWETSYNNSLIEAFGSESNPQFSCPSSGGNSSYRFGTSNLTSLITSCIEGTFDEPILAFPRVFVMLVLGFPLGMQKNMFGVFLN